MKPTNEEFKQAIHILGVARRFIQRGWCQKASTRVRKGKVQFCLSGAVHHAHPFGDRNLARTALTRVLNYEGLVSWNDRRGRTKEQVLATIDKAVKHLEGEINVTRAEAS